MPLPSVTGLAGVVLGVLVLLAWSARRWRLTMRTRLALVAGLALALLWPIGGLSAAGHVRGVSGDLSITSMVLLTLALGGYVRGQHIVAAPEVRRVLAAALLAGAGLYPLALGLGSFDPYALGYGSEAFAGALLVVALVAWYARARLLVGCIVLAVAGYLLGVLESDNLWDYLLDAALVLYALVHFVARMVAAARRRLAARA